MPDVVTAESTPAPVAQSEPAPASEPSFQEQLDSLNPEQRAKWRMTGELPSEKPVESEPTKPSEPSIESKTAPESEPGKIIEEKTQLTPEERSARDKRNNERRFTQLNRTLGEVNAEVRRLREENAALKQGKTESAPVHEGEPKLEDFETYEDHKKALASFHRQQARREFEQEQRQARAQSEKQTTQQAWKAKATKYVQANPDADLDAALAHVGGAVDASPIGDVVFTAVLESEYGPQIVEYLADHDDELEALSKASKYGAGKIIARIEDTFAGKPKTPPAPNPKDVLKNAPAPPADIRGRSGPVEDPLEVAYEKGDFKTIKRLENERDIARMKRGS